MELLVINVKQEHITLINNVIFVLPHVQNAQAQELIAQNVHLVVIQIQIILVKHANHHALLALTYPHANHAKQVITLMVQHVPNVIQPAHNAPQAQLLAKIVH